MNNLLLKDRVPGGLWGAVVGDALGVPVEFRSRPELQADPVTDLRGHGTYDQPAGTWSDDSSLMLCTVDSLLENDFDTEDMGRRFVRWSQGELWTPWGHVFDIGGTTAREIPSSGYVVDTLTAGLWCLLTSKDYPETVLKAVNLGGDTDTTGIVAGGLAGVYHGLDAVPERWRLGMARATDLESLFSRFVGLFPLSHPLS